VLPSQSRSDKTEPHHETNIRPSVYASSWRKMFKCHFEVCILLLAVVMSKFSVLATCAASHSWRSAIVAFESVQHFPYISVKNVISSTSRVSKFSVPSRNSD
jgi:hypothetical protein